MTTYSAFEALVRNTLPGTTYKRFPHKNVVEIYAPKGYVVSYLDLHALAKAAGTNRILVGEAEGDVVICIERLALENDCAAPGCKCGARIGKMKCDVHLELAAFS